MEKHTGGCHCKAARYEVDIDLTKPVLVCNCSHCQIKGVMLSFVPEEQFRITKGEENLTEYRFNKEKIAHLFCKTCGVQPFGRAMSPDGVPTVAVNVRTIDDIDLDSLEIHKFDGRSI